jgi:glycosyltransferase involved in cell wall biosynthesis
VGGTETIVKNVAERMAQRGHDVTVHASYYNPNYNGELKKSETLNGVKIVRYRLFPYYIFFPRIKNPEIIHLFSYGDNFIIQSMLHGFKSLLSSPIGEEVYAQHKTRNRLVGRYVLDKSKKIFAMTSYEKEELNSIYGINSDKIVIWPAGVGDEAFTSPNLKNVREIFLKIADKKYFIRLARIDRIKKLEFGINLLPYLKDLTYVIAGTTDNSEYLYELKELSKKLQVDDRLIITGKVNEDEKKFLLLNSLFYLIANRETFGGATIEAMAQSVPIIAPNVEEYKDIVLDRVNALIYEYNSTENCVDSIKLLLQDDNFRRELGKNGEIRAREKFHWDHIIDVAEKIYYELIDDDR